MSKSNMSVDEIFQMGLQWHYEPTEARDKLYELLASELPEKIKYIAELDRMRIAVNEAVRGAGWQLRAKEEIEAYNQAIDEVTQVLNRLFGKDTEGEKTMPQVDIAHNHMT